MLHTVSINCIINYSNIHLKILKSLYYILIGQIKLLIKNYKSNRKILIYYSTTIKNIFYVKIKYINLKFSVFKAKQETYLQC